ncbi:MAG: hypothetical protein ACOY0T_09520 [Myxococcota bacterium]
MKTKQQLEAEATERRAALEEVRRDLANARERHRRTRDFQDYKAIEALSSREREHENALDGVLEDLAAMARPRRVEVSDSRENLLKRRAELVQRQAYLRREREDAMAQERRRCGSMSEKHAAQHVANIFGNCREPGIDEQRLVDHIDQQLAELDRRDAAQVVAKPKQLPARGETGASA